MLGLLQPNWLIKNLNKNSNNVFYKQFLFCIKEIFCHIFGGKDNNNLPIYPPNSKNIIWLTANQCFFNDGLKRINNFTLCQSHDKVADCSLSYLVKSSFSLMKTVDNKARKSSSSIIFGSDFVLFLFDVRYYKKKNRILLNCEREKKTSLRGICMKAY